MDQEVKSAERCRRCLDVEEWRRQRETWHHLEEFSEIKDGTRRQWACIFLN